MFIEIRFGQETECMDGVCGVIAFVVIAISDMRLTHLVVSQLHQPWKLRMVPSELITESSGKRLYLNCAWFDFTALPELIHRDYIRKTLPPKIHGDQDYVLVPAQEVVVGLQLASGEAPLSAWARVHAGDWNLGKLDAIQIQPQTWRILNLIVRERRFYRERILTVPVEAIRRIEDNIVYTNKNKNEIERMQQAPRSLIADAHILLPPLLEIGP